MKVCKDCGDEIMTVDRENQCQACEKKKIKKAAARERRRANDEVMRSLGLKKVRGALGGTYWE